MPIIYENQLRNTEVKSELTKWNEDFGPPVNFKGHSSKKEEEVNAKLWPANYRSEMLGSLKFWQRGEFKVADFKSKAETQVDSELDRCDRLMADLRLNSEIEEKRRAEFPFFQWIGDDWESLEQEPVNLINYVETVTQVTLDNLDSVEQTQEFEIKMTIKLHGKNKQEINTILKQLNGNYCSTLLASHSGGLEWESQNLSRRLIPFYRSLGISGCFEISPPEEHERQNSLMTAMLIRWLKMTKFDQILKQKGYALSGAEIAGPWVKDPFCSIKLNYSRLVI